MFSGNKYSAAEIERYHTGKMTAEEMHALLRDADEHIKQYKENHDGWL